MLGGNTILAKSQHTIFTRTSRLLHFLFFPQLGASCQISGNSDGPILRSLKKIPLFGYGGPTLHTPANGSLPGRQRQKIRQDTQETMVVATQWRERYQLPGGAFGTLRMLIHVNLVPFWAPFVNILHVTITCSTLTKKTIQWLPYDLKGTYSPPSGHRCSFELLCIPRNTGDNDSKKSKPHIEFNAYWTVVSQCLVKLV